MIDSFSALDKSLHSFWIDLEESGWNSAQILDQSIAQVIFVKHLIELFHCQSLQASNDLLGVLYCLLRFKLLLSFSHFWGKKCGDRRICWLRLRLDW